MEKRLRWIKAIGFKYGLGVALVLSLLWWATPTEKDPVEEISYKVPSSLSSAQKIKPQFRDVTAVSGIHRPHIQRSDIITGLHESIGSGACAIDYNRDGWTDILMLNGSGTTHFFGRQKWWQNSKNNITLYKNVRGQRFVDITNEVMLETELSTMGCAVADLNNDGWNDLVISTFDQILLFENSGGNNFKDRSENISQPGNIWSTTISLADIDKDGWIDIYISNYLDFHQNSNKFERNSGYENQEASSFSPELFQGIGNSLFINQQGFKFNNEASRYKLEDLGGRTLSSHFAHINQDLYPDLVVLNDRGSPSKLFINEQKQGFTDQSINLGMQVVERTTSATHLNNTKKNYKTLVIGTGETSQPRKFEFQPSAEGNRFSLRADQTSLSNKIPTTKTHWGLTSFDANLDGSQDIMIVSGKSSPDIDSKLMSQGEPNTLLVWNEGEFTPESMALINTENMPLSSRCAFTLDFDNDGRKDLFITQNNDYPQLLKNETSPSNWLGIDLNLDTLDEPIWPLRVFFESTTTKQWFDRLQTQGYLCTGENRALFNFPETDEIVGVEIMWSDGEIQKLDVPRKNDYYRISRRGVLHPTNPIETISSSRILIETPSYKAEVLNWLAKNKQGKLFEQELLLHLDSITYIDIETLNLSTTATKPLGIQILGRALESDDTELLLKAIEYAELAESELLLRWLLPLVDHNNKSVSCKASSVFEQYFNQEEALIVRKNQLVRHLLRKINKVGSTQHRLCLIKAIGRSEHYRSIDSLGDLLQDKDMRIVQSAAIAIRHTKDVKAAKLLSSVFSASDIPNEVKLSVLASILYLDKEYDPQINLLEFTGPAPRYKLTAAEVSKFKYIDEDGWIILDSRSNGALSEQFNASRLALHHPEKETNSQSTRKGLQCPQIANEGLISYGSEDKTSVGCINGERFFKNAPEFLLASLGSDSYENRKEAYSALARRKENWAHKLRAELLLDNSQPSELKTIILGELTDSFSTAELKALDEIASDRSQEDLWPNVIPLLLNSGRHITLDKWLEKLSREVKNGRESPAMNIARGLYNVAPKRTLKELIESTRKQSFKDASE